MIHLRLRTRLSETWNFPSFFEKLLFVSNNRNTHTLQVEAKEVYTLALPNKKKDSSANKRSAKEVCYYKAKIYLS